MPLIRSFSLFLLLCTGLSLGAQDFPYQLDWKRESGLLAGGAALSIGSHLVESRMAGLTPRELARQRSDRVWFLDRGATRQYSETHRNLSDDLLRASLALPATLLIAPEPRRRVLVVATLLAETMLLNDGLTKATKVIVRRNRPLTFNPEHDPFNQASNDARQSFVSGHTSNTAALSFFTAKVFHDLYPESPLRPLLWAGAAAIPLLTGHARYQAGKHFPTDIAAGYLLGATLGVLIPELHKRAPAATGWNLDVTGAGIGLVYRW
ncbi:phosphatase PAP2 family protein [Lewinella sp. IMCC34183]|uniref:phosphatase PAP2 family protein n=1 Tax=Lewinella sp. IMCC34183 TaxID=2248762 RepID=UPI000E2470D3|nr:phosphatase PAP2 family protein [Lewinella sp. IMCC34183]